MSDRGGGLQPHALLFHVLQRHTHKDDIIHLCKNLGITNVDEVLNVVEDYYPTSRIPVKTRFFIQEIIEEMEGDGT
jgi:hypothetical protein